MLINGHALSEAYQVVLWWRSKYSCLVEAPTLTEQQAQRRCVLLPKFGTLLVMMCLLQPSSAASERVFSLLNSMFGKDRLHCLRDLVEGSLFLRVNKEDV